jgi:hypothetical protein
MTEDKQENSEEQATESCVEGMSRHEFIRALVRKSLISGALLTTASALTKFDMPAAYAATVGTSVALAG